MHIFSYLIVLTMPVKIKHFRIFAATAQKWILLKLYNALYSFLSHVYFYFGETANLRVVVEIAIFSAEINAYFAVRFRYKNQFLSAQNLLKALLWYLDIRFTRCV